MRPEETSQRGSALLLSMVLVAILAGLVVAALSFSRSELAGAKADLAGDALVECADAARQHLLSHFKMFGTPPTQIELNLRTDKPGVVACAPGLPEGAACLKSNHIETATTVKGVRLVGAGMAGGGRNAQDLTNKVVRPGALGGQYYTAVVHCEDAQGRQSEVEFGVKFGL